MIFHHQLRVRQFFFFFCQGHGVLLLTPSYIEDVANVFVVLRISASRRLIRKRGPIGTPKLRSVLQPSNREFPASYCGNKQNMNVTHHHDDLFQFNPARNYGDVSRSVICRTHSIISAQTRRPPNTNSITRGARARGRTRTSAY